MQAQPNSTVAFFRRLAIAGASTLCGLLAAAALMGLLAAPAQAAPEAPAAIRAWPGGPAPCNASLQECISGANPGDVISITPGTYNLSVVLTRPVSLVGAGSGQTTLRALSGQRVLMVSGSAISNSVVISGFTMAGGVLSPAVNCPAGCGAGLLITGSARPLLHNLVITGGLAGYAGGGLYAHAGSPLTLHNVQALSNTAHAFGGGINALDSLEMIGGQISRNRCLHASCWGGGLYADKALTLTGVSAISNTSHSLGGAVFANQSVSLSGGAFTGNRCQQAGCQGGALYASGALQASGASFYTNTAQAAGGALQANSPASLSGTLFSGNRCTEGNCSGGAVHSGQALQLHNTRFISNSSGLQGGALHTPASLTDSGSLFERNACLTVTCNSGAARIEGAAALAGTQFISNTAQFLGGAAYISGPASLSGALFQANTAMEPGGRGGGVYAFGQTFISNTQFISNTAERRGAAVYFAGPGSLHGSQLERNVCTHDTSCQGGSVYADGTLTVTASAIVAGEAVMGGGLYVESGSVRIVNSLFAGNRARGERGSAMWLQTPGGATLWHNTIANASVSGGSAVRLADGSASLLNNIVSNAFVGFERTGGTVVENYTLFAGVALPYSGTISAGGSSILNGQASFVNAAGGDFRLGTASDAIDNGTNIGVNVDYFGAPRPQGANFDMGYHEFGMPWRVLVPALLRLAGGP